MMNSPFRPMKQRKEAHQMLELGGIVRGGRILEIGCGRGVGVEIIFDTFDPSYVEAFDFDPDQVGLAKQRLLSRYQDKVKLYVASATEIPSPDSLFDAVFDFGALHHIPNNSIAIGEISRVLKPDGRFFFMELLSSLTMKPIMRFLTQHPPEAQFTWDELSMKLANSGLVVSENSYVVSSTRVVGVARKSTL
ncbi:MAG: class I SAM-dependent methyltransferase [Euryarchaeota archaeon]|nr:class I SAM-dependent methyltransferase [Euryarchaeota archaeon]